MNLKWPLNSLCRQRAVAARQAVADGVTKGGPTAAYGGPEQASNSFHGEIW